MKLLVVVCSSVLLVMGLGVSAKADTSFALEGAGSASCKQFVESFSNDKDSLISFSGWLDGYISAYNEFTEATFDITPWQQNSLLLILLRNHCKKSDSQRFYTAVKYMLNALNDERLIAKGELVLISQNNQKVYFDNQVVQRIKLALNSKIDAKLSVDAIFDQDTEAALRQFQNEQKLEPSGFPNQETLRALFFK